jgi:methyl-accepting chemotaxis protein
VTGGDLLVDLAGVDGGQVVRVLVVGGRFCKGTRRAVRRIEEGSLEEQVVVDDAGEIGRLQAGFNRMVAGLREREAYARPSGPTSTARSPSTSSGRAPRWRARRSR